MAKHLHLDTLGGISGDMFAGALLDCRPELAEALPGVLEQAGFAGLVELRSGRHNDGLFDGTTFSVREAPANARPLALQVPAHSHRPFGEIREVLAASGLSEAVKRHALGIFQCLAEAEARVHGTDIDAVAFHEVGAWDSIADVVCAAFLIDALDVRSCTVSSLPMGRGWTSGAHGRLPLPAPAVALLLEGYKMHDDGLEGERVTPTGAAILRHLRASQEPESAALVLRDSGIGFGTRTFAGTSNVLRALLFDSGEDEECWLEQRILELAFEVDDQNAEDLALALERIRALEGVLDVGQYAVQGKKQRAAASVRVLLEPGARAAVIEACFDETTTLGIREAELRRAVLRRLEIEVEKDGQRFRAKLAQRPNGQISVKADLDDLAAQAPGYLERAILREEIEGLALDKVFGQEDED